MMLLGLIFELIELVMIVISVMIIYSLLLLNVVTQAFKQGVMRLIGLSQKGLAKMLIAQSLSFVLPAIIAAFICCIPILKSISLIIEQMSGY